MKNPTFKPGTPEHRKKSLRKALKSAHTPAANAKRAASIRAFHRNKKLNGNRAHAIPADQQLVPLDAIPGERPPVIAYSDTPGGKITGPMQRMDPRERLIRLKILADLVETTKKVLGS